MDFVILWVNDKDPKWREAFEKYSLLETGEKRDCRYRDWENLHYWFRGVEKFAPWVDKIFFVTANQTPSWMNVDHPKLRIVNHEEYIPKELLPTFNSSTIEMFLHLIPGLSEQFVFFNDDFFIINKLSPGRFFRKGLPVDICAMNIYAGDELSINKMCNLEIINRYFNKRQTLLNHFFKWFDVRNGKHLIRTCLLIAWSKFVGFYDPHLPQPFLKSMLEEVWQRESHTIIRFCSRFRQRANTTQYLYRYWQLVRGKVACKNVDSDSAVFYLSSLQETEKLAEIINKQKKNMVVINDSAFTDFEKAKEIVNCAFENILPEKSSFEK